MEERTIIEIIEKIDKFKLIDVISGIYYYYLITGDYNEMMSTVELEYIINYIYKAKNTGKRKPTLEEINLILELANAIINKKGNISIEKLEQNEENLMFTQAIDNFALVKEDVENDTLVFEYLNLFNPVNYFFRMTYLFKIEDFLNFINLIQIEYTNRIKLIQKILEGLNDKVTKNILIEYLLNLDYNILNFNEKTLARNEEELISLKNVLKKFSATKEFCHKINFEDYPIFKEGDTYIVSSIVTLAKRTKYIFEKEIRRDKILGNIYAYKKGEYLEILTKNVIQDILKDSKIYSNIKYRENKQDRECDLLVIYDQVILIIEVKSRALKEISKDGNKEYLNQDLEDNIYKAYKQATRMEEYLKNNKNVTLRIQNDYMKLKIENTDKFRIFKIGITLENFRNFAVQYAEFNSKTKKDMLFFNINDLKFMSKYFRYQTEFIHYISQRIKTNQYIREFSLYDELYLFSEYKISNLQRILNNNHIIKIYDTGRYKLFDLRFDGKKKEEILRGKIHPLIDKMIKRMEREKLPTHSFVIMDLLDLDYNAHEYIFEQIKKARLLYKEKRELIHVALKVDEEKDSKGINIVITVADKKSLKDSLEATIILGSILKRKSPNYGVIGILNNIEDKEESIMACMEIGEPKEGFDKALEKIEELKNILIS